MPTLDKVKQRIKSVQSTSKITKAMELVATAKIKKARETYENTVKYFDIVFNNIIDISSQSDDKKSKYLNYKEGKTIWIVLSSDLGLCGGYNNNNIKALNKEYKKGDALFAIGQKAVSLSSTFKLEITKEYTQVISQFEFDNANDVVKDALDLFETDESFTSIKLVASKFINNVTFEPELIQLVPIQLQNKEEEKVVKKQQQKFFEQNPTLILEKAIPMFMGYALFAKVHEAKLIEQASRRLAMEAATKNANELLDDLKIQYNQKRQANITQEISEIIAGANA